MGVRGTDREDGGAAVNPALAWFKSSYSTNENENCVEVAVCPHAVHVRDSKLTDGPAFAVGPGAWAAFVGSYAKAAG
ncbi:DUF397 domain-containing protein [Streptomyces sp. NPDC054887]